MVSCNVFPYWTEQNHLKIICSLACQNNCHSDLLFQCVFGLFVQDYIPISVSICFGLTELSELQIKLRWVWCVFVTYTIIQNIMRSDMCSLHSPQVEQWAADIAGGARGAVGCSVPCSKVSPQLWTLPARAGIRTYNLGLPRVSSPMLYPLGHDCQSCFAVNHGLSLL